MGRGRLVLENGEQFVVDRGGGRAVCLEDEGVVVVLDNGPLPDTK